MQELEQRLVKRHIIEDFITIQGLIDTFRTVQGVGSKHSNFALFGDDWLIGELRKQLKITGVYSYSIVLNGYGQLVEVDDGNGNTVSGDQALFKIRRYYINLSKGL